MTRIVLVVVVVLLGMCSLACTGSQPITRKPKRTRSSKKYEGPADTTDPSLYLMKRRRRKRGYWCTYRYSHWRTALNLRLNSRSSVFARVNTYRNPAKTYLRFSKYGPKAGVFVRMTSRGVTLRGWATGSRGVPLHLNRPVRFGENVIAGRYATLHWRGYDRRAIALELDLQKYYQTNERLIATVPCEHTAMFSKKVGPLHKKAGLPAPTKYVYLKKNTKIPVTMTPEGDPVGSLLPITYSRRVAWYQKQGQFVQILARVSGVGIYGWIPDSAIKPIQPNRRRSGLLGIFGSGVGGLGFRGRRKKPSYRRYIQYICRKPVPLLVWNGRKLARVGLLRKRIPIALLKKNSRWATVRLRWWRSWITLKRSFTWTIPSKSLQSCREIRQR
ncbi:MAG: hypothetical protein EP343_28950 [Deltaproteobacteria bacterium]|nr:MAG: hypothetical protein EP343_28950 [Deltaproteobacteria bacterium]